jgi:hypothetical protein
MFSQQQLEAYLMDVRCYDAEQTAEILAQHPSVQELVQQGCLDIAECADYSGVAVA